MSIKTWSQKFNDINAKSRIFKFLKYFSILCILTLGCKKRPFDYRNKYCGNYDFHYIEIPWTSINGNLSPNEGSYTGKVYYEKKANGDIILINYKGNITLTFAIDRQGKIVGCGGTGQFEKHKSVAFEHKTSSCSSGGLGAGYNYTVTGTKK